MADGSEPPKEIRDALSDMKKYTRQKPNSHILGVGPRLTMRIYCLSNPDKSNFWHKYLRRKGQAPVIYNENAAIQTCNQLSGLLKSKGCFVENEPDHKRHDNCDDDAERNLASHSSDLHAGPGKP